jgi:uncharacterized protein (DUF305 family)
MTAVLDDATLAQADAPPPSRLRAVLISVIVLALLAGAVAGGVLWGRHQRSSAGASVPSATSVDVGFARDMTIHHIQAVTMASYARDYTDNPQIKLLAHDIEDQQKYQVGEMQGWLDVWGDPLLNPAPMAWMAGHAHLQSDGLMPGMASEPEMTKLQTLHGNALDIMFLQLMIRHHQGGVPMAQYAAQNATQPYVRDLAQAMVAAQSSELVTMEQLLRQLGGAPLAPPTE